jgi:hypothetical protein
VNGLNTERSLPLFGNCLFHIWEGKVVILTEVLRGFPDVLAGWRPSHTNLLLFKLSSENSCVMAAGSLYISSSRTAQRTPFPTALLLFFIRFFCDHCLTTGVFAEPLPNTGCFRWLHNSGLQQTWHITLDVNCHCTALHTYINTFEQKFSSRYFSRLPFINWIEVQSSTSRRMILTCSVHEVYETWMWVRISPHI